MDVSSSPPDEPFTTVPVSLVAGTDRDSVFAALTRQRRAYGTGARSTTGCR